MPHRRPFSASRRPVGTDACCSSLLALPGARRRRRRKARGGETAAAAGRNAAKAPRTAARPARLPRHGKAVAETLRQSAGAERRRPVHGLAGDRDQPRRAQRLRRLRQAATRSPSSAATRTTGALTQAPGKAGCVAAKGRRRLRRSAIGLIAPNSVAVSPDGKNVYATSRDGASVTTFRRNRKTGALRELPPSASGCISGLPFPAAPRAGAEGPRRGRRLPRREERLRR